MLDWLSQYSNIINIFINACVLLVWVFYAQLLLSSYWQYRRSRLLINQIKGKDLDATLLVANMGEQPVFIQGLLADVQTDDRAFTQVLTDVELHATGDDPDATSRTTAQGTLSSGGYMELGAFRDLVRWTVPQDQQHRCRSLSVRIVFLHGSSRRPVGIWRRFTLNHEQADRPRVYPAMFEPRRLSRPWHAGRVRGWLEESL